MSRKKFCDQKVGEAFKDLDQQTIEEMGEFVDKMQRKYKNKKELKKALNELRENQSIYYKRLRARMARNLNKLNVAVETLDATDAGFTPGTAEYTKEVVKRMGELVKVTDTIREGAGRNVESISNSLAHESFTFMTGELSRRGVIDEIRTSDHNADILSELRVMTSRDWDGKSVTNNPIAFETAKVFSQVQDKLLMNLRDAGVDISRLDGYTIRQVHDRSKIRPAGEKAWIDFMLGKDRGGKSRLDLNRVFGPEEIGDEAAMRRKLANMYKDITEGQDIFDGESTALTRTDKLIQKRSFGSVQSSASKSRKLHFGSGADAAEYAARFGNENLLEVMGQSIMKASRHAGLVEIFGSDLVPHSLFKPGGGLDSGAIGDFKRGVKKRYGITDEDIDKGTFGGLDNFDRSLRQVMGAMAPDNTNVIAQTTNALLAWNNITKLGGASLLAGITDPGFIANTMSALNDKGVMTNLGRSVKDITRIFPDRESQEQLSQLFKIGIESELISMAGRFGGDNSVPGRISAMQDAFFKVIQFERQTRTAKLTALRMFGADLAMNSTKAFNELPGGTQRLLKKHRIGEKQWDLLRSEAIVEDATGTKLIAPEGLANIDESRFSSPKAKRDMIRAFVAVNDEISNWAVPTPGVANKVWLQTDSKPGSIRQEAARLVAQYKSFAFAAMTNVSKNVKFATGEDTLSKAVRTKRGMETLFSSAATMSILGYLSLVAADVTNNREPRDFSAEVALESFVRGGFGGIYGDILLRDYTTGFGSMSETLLGPSMGMAQDAWGVVQSTVKEGFRDEGDLSKSVAKALKFGRRNIPFSNIPGIKPAVDYLLVDGVIGSVNSDSVDYTNKFYEDRGSPRLIGD